MKREKVITHAGYIEEMPETSLNDNLLMIRNEIVSLKAEVRLVMNQAGGYTYEAVQAAKASAQSLGYANGRSEGYKEGHEEGYKQGKKDGYKEGYNIGTEF